MKPPVSLVAASLDSRDFRGNTSIPSVHVLGRVKLIGIVMRPRRVGIDC
jgi:hypothetical protein